MSSVPILFLSIGIAAAAVSIIASAFAMPGYKVETIITVVAIYFCIGFFGYLRTYAKEQRERMGE